MLFTAVKTSSRKKSRCPRVCVACDSLITCCAGLIAALPAGGMKWALWWFASSGLSFIKLLSA
eukprot:7058356-Prorocentrum_lima.AAC.1